MSSEAAMSWTEAREAAGAALDGLKQRRTGKVSEDEHKLLLQRYESTLCVLQTTCEDRDKARKLFLEHQSVSKAVIFKLDKKCATLQADLRACQKELRKYEQDCQQMVAETEQVHLRYEVQLAALKTEGAGMQRTIRDLQQQLSKKEEYAKEVHNLRDQLAAHGQELHCRKQELTAVRAENQELKELNIEVQHLVAQAKDNVNNLMKMLSAARQSNSNKVSVGTTTDDDALSQSTDNTTQQQAQVQVVLNLKASSDEEGNLRTPNTSLQKELVLHKQLLCLLKQQLKAVRVKSKQLQEHNKQLEQMLFNVTERLVELEQKPDVALVVHVDDDKKEPMVVEQVQPVVSLTVNLVNTTEEARTQALNDVKHKLAAAHCQFEQEMTAMKVDNSQLREQVDALQHLVVEKDDKIQKLEQSKMMVDQVMLQMADLEHQVSVLMECKQYLEAKLTSRSGDTLHVQQQLSAAMQALKDLQMAAALAPTPAVVTSSASTDVVIAATEHVSPVHVKHSSNSKSSSLLGFKRRFTADSSSSSQPGTPGTPALSQEMNSFAVDRGSSSRSSSNDHVEISVDGCEVDGSVVAADDSTFGSDSDSSALLISHNKLKQPRHRNLFNSMRRRLTGSFLCLRTNSSNMVKEL